MIDDIYKNVKDWVYYRDLFDQREFQDAEEMAHLAIIIMYYKGVRLNPYTCEQSFVDALNNFGLKVDGVTYAIHPVLRNLVTFTPEYLVN